MKMLTGKQFKQRTADRESETKTVDEQVTKIIDQVRKYGDKALYSYTEKFDGVKLNNLIVTEKEFDDAEMMVNPAVIQALYKAKANIEQFHRQQAEKSWFYEKEQGVTLGQKITP